RELENSIHYFADNPTADLNAFTNTILSQALDESPVPPHSVVTINDVTETPIPTAAASPLAIILHELIENSIKHAFSAEGDVHYLQVRLAQKTAVEMGHYHWELQVIDNGVGLEPGEHKQGRGLQVVHSLVKSLGGRIEIETGHGTHITVRLPLHRGATEPESDALPA
ncbi:MAG: ATP-binding protein, partial [Halioglobus sp.]